MDLKKFQGRRKFDQLISPSDWILAQFFRSRVQQMDTGNFRGLVTSCPLTEVDDVVPPAFCLITRAFASNSFSPLSRLWARQSTRKLSTLWFAGSYSAMLGGVASFGPVGAAGVGGAIIAGKTAEGIEAAATSSYFYGPAAYAQSWWETPYKWYW